MPLFFGMYAWTIATFSLGFYKGCNRSKVFSLFILVLFLLVSIFFKSILPEQTVATMGHRNLVFGFLMGIVFYSFKDTLLIDVRILFGLCIFAFFFRNTDISFFVNAILIFYTVLLFSISHILVKHCKLPINLSMGVFLYSFPIQQIVSSFFVNSLPVLNFSISVFLSLFVAYLSAKYLESLLYRLADIFYDNIQRGNIKRKL